MKNEDKEDTAPEKRPKSFVDDDDEDDDDEDESDLEETSKALGKKPKRKIYSSDEESEDEPAKIGKPCGGKKIINGLQQVYMGRRCRLISRLFI